MTEKSKPTKARISTSLAIIAGATIVASDVLAQATGLEGAISGLVTRSAEGFKIARNTLYVIAAFGMLGVGAAAYFGRMNWKWAWHIIGGCALIGTSGLLIDLLFDTSSGGGAFDETGFQK